MLRTGFTELLGLDYPIMSAPMAMDSGATLTAAASKAGPWARSVPLETRR